MNLPSRIFQDWTRLDEVTEMVPTRVPRWKGCTFKRFVFLWLAKYTLKHYWCVSDNHETHSCPNLTQKNDKIDISKSFRDYKYFAFDNVVFPKVTKEKWRLAPSGAKMVN